MKYYNTKSLYAQGLAESSLAREYPFQRLAQKYKKSVRKEVWELSENSAGVSISFLSDTTEIVVKWSVKHDLKMLLKNNFGSFFPIFNGTFKFCISMMCCK